MILNLLEQTTPSELGVKWLVSSWYSDSLFSVLIGWLSKVLSRFGMFFAEKRAQLVLIVCNCWRDEKSQTLTKCFGGLTLENKTAENFSAKAVYVSLEPFWLKVNCLFPGIRSGLVSIIQKIHQQSPQRFQNILAEMPQEHAQVLMAAATAQAPGWQQFTTLLSTNLLLTKSRLSLVKDNGFVSWKHTSCWLISRDVCKENRTWMQLNASWLFMMLTQRTTMLTSNLEWWPQKQ